MITSACFDLETSDLNADSGIVLCGVIQSSTQRKPVVIRTDDTNPRWKSGQRGDDSAAVRQIADVLEAHDVIAAHNGAKFDIPFLRTRMLFWKMRRLPDIKFVDPLQVAWRKFRWKSNRLGSIGDQLGIRQKKTPLDMSTWKDAVLNGSRSSMDLIVEHCVADVKLLAELLDYVKPYIRLFDDRGSAL